MSDELNFVYFASDGLTPLAPATSGRATSDVVVEFVARAPFVHAYDSVSTSAYDDIDDAETTSQQHHRIDGYADGFEPAPSPPPSVQNKNNKDKENNNNKGIEAAHRDWNGEQQALLDRLHRAESFDLVHEVEVQLHALHAQFVLTATAIGQTIIREAFVLDRDKSIPRGPFAGLAGGSKYAAGGIFFKYAHDLYGIYGGNEAAAKAAGHEARSHAALSSLCRSPLRQPLCIVLDFLGYRLICLALLPISQRSLQYGSADGGRHVLCQHAGIARAAAAVARALYLKAHRAGLPARPADADLASPVPPKRTVDRRAADNDGYLSDSLHSVVVGGGDDLDEQLNALYDDDNDHFDDEEDDDDNDLDGAGYDSLEDDDDAAAATAVAARRDDGTAELHFPGDIECHLGSDGRFYVIDVARLFPPEAPSLFLFGILLDPDSNSMTEVELSVRERRRSIITADVHQRLVALLGTAYRTVQVGDDMQLHYAGAGPVNALATALVNHMTTTAAAAAGRADAVTICGLALALRSERSAHLINLLRPELLQAHQTPLSSDAYSMWGFDQHAVHNAEVLAATRELATSVAPRLVAAWLADAASGESPPASLLERSLRDEAPRDPAALATHLPIDGADLVRELHRSGINVRYLGLVRSQIGNRADERASRLRGLLLIEMISRVCKNYLRTCLRDVRSALIADYHNVIARLFNLVLGVGRDADQFWAVHIRCLLLLKFGRYSSPLHEGERSAAHDLRSQLSKASLFLRLQEATGVLFRVTSANDTVDLGALERYFARQSGEPPFRASQIVRLAGKTKKLVFAQGGIGVGVGVGLGGTRRPGSALPNHAPTAGFASRFDELRARFVCASLPALPDALFEWAAASTPQTAPSSLASPPPAADVDGDALPTQARWVHLQAAHFSRATRSGAKNKSTVSLQPTPIAAAAATPAADSPSPLPPPTPLDECAILPTAPLPPLPNSVGERLRVERRLVPLSWRAEQGAGAGVVSTLAHAAAVLSVARQWAQLAFDVVRRGALAAQARPNEAALAAVVRLAGRVRRRALLWLSRGAASVASAFERQSVAADSAIACTVTVASVCELIHCADNWVVQHARGVAQHDDGDGQVPQLAALLDALLAEDAASAAHDEWADMPLRAVDDDGVVLECAAALHVALRQSIAWLEQLYGGRGRPFGGGHPLLIVLWRRLAAALRVSVEHADAEQRRPRLTEANDLMGFAAHLARTFSPTVNERELVARLLTHPNLSITLSKAPARLLGVLLPLLAPHQQLANVDSPRGSLLSPRTSLRDSAASDELAAAAAAPDDADQEELPLVHTFGHNKDGRLGLGDDADQRAPCVVGSLHGMNVAQVECGDRFTVALCRDGQVYAWGDCSLGHVLGLDANVYRAPVLCQRLQGQRIVRVLSINTYNHRATIAVDDTGGAAVFGQLGSLPSDVDELLADGALRNVAAGGWRLFVDGRVVCGRIGTKRAESDGASESSSAADGGGGGSTLPRGVSGVALGAVSASHAVVLGALSDGGTHVLTQQHGQMLSIIRDEPCVDVACGRQFVTVLAQSGVVHEWTPSSASPLSFAAVLGKVRIVRVAAGDWHAAALSAAGDLFTWGSDKYGQCGHGSNDPESTVKAPRRVSALRTRWVVDVSCGSNHTAVVSLVRRRALADNSLVARMRPLLQQPLTHAMRLNAPAGSVPTAPPPAAPADAVAKPPSLLDSPARQLSFAAAAAALTVASSAALQCWMWRVPFRTTHTVNGSQPIAGNGASNSNSNSNGNGANSATAMSVDELRLCRITRRSQQSIRSQNPFHERAAKAPAPASGVRPLPGLQRCEFVVPRRASTTGAAQAALIGVGGVRGWGRMDDSITLVCHGAVLTAGRNADGQLGHGDRLTRATRAEALAALQSETVVSVAVSSHAAFVTDSGRLFTCGRNADGQCGHGDMTTRLVPRSVVALHLIAIASVACGASHSLASDRSGEVWSWGGNAWGQLGHGDRSPRPQPIHVRYMHQVVSVAAGHSHSAALTRGAALFAWGYGRYGALGLGSLRDEFVPRRVHLLEANAAPVDEEPELRRSAYGNRQSRNSVTRGANVRLLACGPSHTIAVDTDNRVWFWGGHIDVGAASPRLAHHIPPHLSETTNSATGSTLALQSIDGGFQCAAALARDAHGFQHAFALLFGSGDLLGVEMLVCRNDGSKSLCAVDAMAVHGRLRVPRLDETVTRQYVVAFASGSSQFVALL